MKRVFLFVFIVLIAWVLWVSGFPLPYLLNNYRLTCFAGQLDSIPLPPRTEKIGGITKKFGNLGTCSKHGDYYTEYRIASTLSYAQLKEHYGRFYVQVPEIDNVLLASFRGLGTSGPRAVEVEKVEGSNNRYIIYAFDPGYWHNDFRCW